MVLLNTRDLMLTYDRLASRQRKKKHTENLEQKEKDLEGRLLMLCQQVDTLKLQLENAESQRHFYAEEHAKAHELFGDALSRNGQEEEAAIQWSIAESLRKDKNKS